MPLELLQAAFERCPTTCETKQQLPLSAVVEIISWFPGGVTV